MKRRPLQTDDRASLPQPSSTELMGRQSVRATFKLSSRAIETLSIVAVHLGIKQKSLFDHLIEDVHTLEMIARNLEQQKFAQLERIQKTFVLSRRTLSCLEEASRHYSTPRDALVEYSIERLLPVIVQERKKHQLRKVLLKEFNAYVRQGQEMMERAQAALGADDLACGCLESSLGALVHARRQLAEFVEKGSAIEEFERLRDR